MIGSPAAADAALALDGRILRTIDDWRRGRELADDEFDALALDLFAHQARFNEPYRRFAATVGYDDLTPPANWRAIPAVPASAFKDATLATFDVARAELEFHTSGTTLQRPGTHYMERALLYDEALSAGFSHFMLADGARLLPINLVPDPAERPHSSLGYMMGRVAQRFGRGAARYYLHGDEVDLPELRRDLRTAADQDIPVCIAGTAFAFAWILEALGEERLPCAHGSRVMETGGFKGRAKRLLPTELYARLAATFGLEPRHIVAEYGMTELTSQYYDALASRSTPLRIKTGPPWLRTLVVDERGAEVLPGDIGFLRHVDLANRGSAIAIQTEDRGYAVAGGFVLLGRDDSAALRGCSLDAEDLFAARG